MINQDINNNCSLIEDKINSISGMHIISKFTSENCDSIWWYVVYNNQDFYIQYNFQYPKEISVNKHSILLEMFIKYYKGNL